MHDAKRLLDFPSLLNARDLGGYPTVDGSKTRWRSLLRSDDLAQLTLAGLQAFSNFGVETVVDLRWPDEVADSPTQAPVAAEPEPVCPRSRLATIRPLLNMVLPNLR